MSTIRSFRAKLLTGFGIAVALILTAGVLSYSAQHSPGNTAEIAASVFCLAAVACAAGLAIFANRVLGSTFRGLDLVAECAQRIGEGEVPGKITGTFHGEFEILQHGLNACIDSLGGLVEANKVLHRMAANDHTVKVVGNYRGIFAEVAAATNLALERVRAATLACNNVAKGDYRENLEQFKKIGKRSENDMLLPGFIEMMEAIDSLVHDAQALSAAAVKGDLSKRADVGKHRGEYRKVIQGVNDMLDAVIQPLTTAVQYVDQISKGEIPPKIATEAQGEFATLKNSLNSCIDGLGGLVEAKQVLQRMASNDHTVKIVGAYRGIFAEVATATNLALERVKAATLGCNNVAKGDYRENLEQFKRIGRRSENDVLLPAFIEMMETVDALVLNAQTLSAAAANGDLSMRADAGKLRGEYRKVIQGMNDMLDAITVPLNTAAGKLAQIARGEISGEDPGDVPRRIQRSKGKRQSVHRHSERCGPRRHTDLPGRPDRASANALRSGRPGERSGSNAGQSAQDRVRGSRGRVQRFHGKRRDEFHRAATLPRRFGAVCRSRGEHFSHGRDGVEHPTERRQRRADQ